MHDKETHRSHKTESTAASLETLTQNRSVEGKGLREKKCSPLRGAAGGEGRSVGRANQARRTNVRKKDKKTQQSTV